MIELLLMVFPLMAVAAKNTMKAFWVGWLTIKLAKNPSVEEFKIEDKLVHVKKKKKRCKRT